jgi:NAD(P)-dependent dehydrogenase (short-subunit alcohol dehydrogenase family)
MAKGLFDLTGKVAVITGGNSGIGLAFARGIAKQGGSVEIWARNVEKNAEAVKALQALGSGKFSSRQVDVASEQAIADGMNAVMKDYGRIDFVFANAGPPPTYNSVFDLPTEHYKKFQDVALHGAFFTLREGARHMKARAEAGEPGGSLVACGSLSMFQGLPGKQEYASSKAAMGAIVRGLAIELGPLGIRANIVSPGLTRTNIGDGQDPRMDAMFKHFATKIPMGRVGTLEDFEGIAAYLCSDASAWHSGDNIIIDGADLIKLGY